MSPSTPPLSTYAPLVGWKAPPLTDIWNWLVIGAPETAAKGFPGLGPKTISSPGWLMSTPWPRIPGSCCTALVWKCGRLVVLAPMPRRPSGVSGTPLNVSEVMTPDGHGSGDDSVAEVQRRRICVVMHDGFLFGRSERVYA